VDYKLLVVDIDGTILGDTANPTPPVIEALNQAQQAGVKLAIATGRMYRSALRFHRLLDSPLPLISYQGALIKDPKDNRVYLHEPVPLEYALEVLSFLAQMDVSLHVYLNDSLYVASLSPETVAYAKRSGVEPVVVPDLFQVLTAEPTKILAVGKNAKLMDEILALLKEKYQPEALYLTRSTDFFVEVAHPSASKGNAVKFLAEKVLEITADEVICIGDNFNDLEMIAYAGLGIAMKGGPSRVQEQANWVAPSVEEDGVATAIHKFITL
jgi:Cof subfamily protein (haloacid dehalogenase superfamily)